MYTFFNTTSAAPHCVPACFLRRSNLRLALVSALQMCGFQVCRLSKVSPRYVALSICWSFVRYSMILTGFILVDNVNHVVNVLFRLICTHHSFALFESMLIAV